MKHIRWILQVAQVALTLLSAYSLPAVAQDNPVYVYGIIDCWDGYPCITKIDVPSGIVVDQWTGLSFAGNGGGLGLAVVGNKAYYTTRLSGSVWVYDLKKRTLLSSFSAGPPGLSSLATDGKTLWVLDYATNKSVYVWNISTTPPTYLKTITVNNCQFNNCDALEYFIDRAGQSRLIADRNDHWDPYDVYALNGGNPSLYGFISPPANGDAGIAWDETYFYTSDINSGGIRVFDGAGKYIREFGTWAFEDISAVVQPPQCTPPPNTTMVAWYPFDESVGAQSSANIASGNTGLWSWIGSGAPVPVPGMVGNALSFDGTQFVASPDSIATNFGPAATPLTCSGTGTSCQGSFSIDTWVRVNSVVGVMTLVDKRVKLGSTVIGYRLFLDSGALKLQIADSTGATTFSSGVLKNLGDGKWHHLAVTVDRLNNSGISFFYDGYCFGAPYCGGWNPTARKGSLVNTASLYIGTNSATPLLSDWFIGSLDELEIYNRVLSPEEIAQIYRAGSLGKCKP